ncbi:4Fe-4S dicluster domain-containing protein [Geothrix alkalitolerans]|uniref:4Fe-4S dicluster domain-containing protein n=1 Tax=Geothrix alkalitolerans TaxID=2922724 RepID=UPI001FAFD6A6|nr:4Fe-4S dicluster domain-containing protein [Geothrix alkalitolerans]
MAKKLDEPQERGDFFKSLGTLFAGFVANRVEEAVTNLGPKLLRPPGALDELEFLTKCTRCDKCMRACPENAILKAGPNAGLGLKTPYLDPRSIPCFLCTTLPCVAECDDEALVWPTRTLRDGTVIEGPKAVRMGTARVKPSLCATWGDVDREPRACRVCVDRCPYPEEAIRIAPPAEGEAVGHPVVEAEVCTGCGLCVFACPAEPVAIVVDPRRD